MNVIDGVAKELHMNPDDLVKEGVQTYLKQRLTKIDTEIFALVKKHGVRDVFELDSGIAKGRISEKDAYDDFFALDNLQADKEKMEKLLGKVDVNDR